MSFGWHIRYYMLMNQLVLVSSVHEIYKFNTADSSRIASTSFAVVSAYI